jgi:3-hydroxyisobutyrate dehydrogenase-like beta-hydroxyacid dehydrogenase
MLNYGLVGLGNLGEKIARNLLKKKIYGKGI